MREIRTSGSTRGEWVAPSASPSLLLYRLGNQSANTCIRNRAATVRERIS